MSVVISTDQKMECFIGRNPERLTRQCVFLFYSEFRRPLTNKKILIHRDQFFALFAKKKVGNTTSMAL